MDNEGRSFTPSEFAARLARLRDAMRAHGAEAMLIDDSEILAYYTGYEVSVSFYRACIVPLDGSPLMVLRRLDAAPFRERAWFEGHYGFADTEDAVGAVAAALRAHGLDRVAIGLDYGSHAMTVDTFRRLQDALPATRFVDMTHVPWELRLVKSPAEIECIARASSIADQTMSDIVSMMRPGMSERDVSAFAARRYVELGGESDFVGPISSGRGWNNLHGHLHGHPLSSGDILHIELAPRFAGYGARVIRCIAVGGADGRQQSVAAALVGLQDEQIAAMRPGAAARDVDAILRQGVLRAGLSNSYDNITGYTMGYYPRQPVRASDFTRVFHPEVDWRLEPGMVFHMYTSAQGIAFSETVLVGSDGPRRMTRVERKLFDC